MNSEFYREHESQSICELISKNDGMNLCIDGMWGVGKTSFCHNLKSKLDSDGFVTVYFDSFKSDYQDDPLIAILSEMAKANGKDSSSFFKTAAQYAAPLLKTGIKVALRAATLNVIRGDELDDMEHGAINDMSDCLSSYAESALKEYSKKESSINGLKELITEAIVEDSKGLVIFIDELDRCRPTYALEVIEKIKHVFNIPHVTFIMSMNKSQMLASIGVLYGEFENTETYLEKFIDFTFNLESKAGEEKGISKKYCEYLLKKKQKIIGLEDDSLQLMSDLASNLADNNNLTFRECEKLIDSCVRVSIVISDQKAVRNCIELHVSLLIISGFLVWAARSKALNIVEKGVVSDDVTFLFYFKESFRKDQHGRSVYDIKDSEYVKAMSSVFAVLLMVTHNLQHGVKDITHIHKIKDDYNSVYVGSDVNVFLKSYVKAGCGIG